MLLLRTLSGRTLCLSFQSQPVLVKEVKDRIYELEGIPTSIQRLKKGTKELLNDETVVCLKDEGNDVIVDLLLRLYGGKGGFGSLLRGQGSKGPKTTNFNAMRDLSGRRLRHANAEKELKDWQPPELTKEFNEELAEDYRHLKQTGRFKEKRMCHFGNDCRYKYKCKFVHPDDAEEDLWEEQQKEDEKAKFDLSSRFGGRDAMEGVTSSSYSEISNSVQIGLKALKQKQKYLKAKKRKKLAENDKQEENDEMKSSKPQQEPRQQASSSSSSSSSPSSSSSSSSPSSSSSSSSSSAALCDSRPEKKAKISEVESKVTKMSSEKSYEEIDLSKYASAKDLENFSLNHLKSELRRYGLKCGGTLQQRSERLFLLKDTPLDELPRKVFAKKRKAD